jgi:hypothetical protein
MVVLLAKAAPVGVILRRGPTRWWHVTLWDTKRDAFESGQWFHGRIYPEKCDVSPDGKLWIYFAAKFSLRSADKGYQDSWTAVSRPPYLTALTLWPIGGTYGGNGLFIDSGTVMVGSTEPSNHPDHPPGPLRVMAWTEARPVVPSLDFGWQGAVMSASHRATSYLAANGRSATTTPRGRRPHMPCTGTMPSQSPPSKRIGRTGTNRADRSRPLAASCYPGSSHGTSAWCGDNLPTCMRRSRPLWKRRTGRSNGRRHFAAGGDATNR